MTLTVPPATTTQTASVRVAYVLKRYPRLSETFILHEMLALEALGVRLHVYSLMNPGEDIVHADVQRLQAEVTYLPAFDWPGWQAILRATGYYARHAPGRFWGALWYALWKRNLLVGPRHFLRGAWLARELQRVGIGHVHAHFAHGPASTAHFVHKLSGITFSFTGHAKDVYTTSPLRLSERIAAARFVVTCTQHNVGYLQQHATAQSHIHRIYHGIDCTRFTPGQLAPEDPPLILAVGRLVEKKGLGYLIDACALLHDQGIAFRCQIIGSGPLKETLQTQIDTLGLADVVTLLGARSQEAVLAAYQRATVVALPCVILDNGDRDGIPNVLVEAMAMGLPVVATAISGIPELIESPVNGMLVPPRDAMALADALTNLLGHAEVRAELGAAASATIAARFDLAQNARHLVQLFAEVGAQTVGASPVQKKS